MTGMDTMSNRVKNKTRLLEFRFYTGKTVRFAQEEWRRFG